MTVGTVLNFNIMISVEKDEKTLKVLCKKYGISLKKIKQLLKDYKRIYRKDLTKNELIQQLDYLEGFDFERYYKRMLKNKKK